MKSGKNVNRWAMYEALKKPCREKARSAGEYERLIKKAAKEAGV